MNLEPCALTAQQATLWENTCIALQYNSPHFTYLLYKMSVNVGGKYVALFTREVPIAATDGETLFCNPDTYFTYDQVERTTINAHEILHKIFNHCVIMHLYQRAGKIYYSDGTSLPYDAKLYNIAADLVINDMLFNATVGGRKVFKLHLNDPDPKRNWLHDPSIGTQDDSVDDVYRRLYKRAQKNGGGGGKLGDPGVKGHSFDEHLKPGTSQGKDPDKAAGERNEAKWTAEVAAAAATARAQGLLPESLERAFGKVLNPVISWKEHIRALLNRKAGGGSYDWRKADRRLIVRDIYAPSRSGFGAGTIVVGGDTSGSMSEKDFDMIFAEMAGILGDIKPKRMVIVWCDADIGQVDEVKDAEDLNTIRGKGVKGGGGTDFKPVFKWVTEQGIKPDALVYLTDGEGQFPQHAPDYPVIWGSIKESTVYPFGEVVNIPKQAE